MTTSTPRTKRPIGSDHDREMLAVLVALAPLGSRTSFAIDIRARDCDFAALRRIGWSSGERALIELASALWKGHGDVDLGYICASLDGRFFQAAIDAMAVYRGKDLESFGADAIEAALA